MLETDTQGLNVIICMRGDGETVVRLMESIEYATGPLGVVTVPKFFVSDGCSMPRLFWRLIGHPFDTRYLREAILHDWLYRYQPCGRKAADLIFRAALVGRIGPLRRWAIYWGLRIGGWLAWRRNRKRLAELPTTDIA